MNVKDVMTPHVLSVTPDESIFVAARPMLQKKISGLPVVDGLGNLVGIVGEGDFLHRADTDDGVSQVKAKPSFDAASTRFLLIFLVKPNRE